MQIVRAVKCVKSSFLPSGNLPTSTWDRRVPEQSIDNGTKTTEIGRSCVVGATEAAVFQHCRKALKCAVWSLTPVKTHTQRSTQVNLPIPSHATIELLLWSLTEDSLFAFGGKVLYSLLLSHTTSLPWTPLLHIFKITSFKMRVFSLRSDLSVWEPAERTRAHSLAFYWPLVASCLRGRQANAFTQVLGIGILRWTLSAIFLSSAELLAFSTVLLCKCQYKLEF